MANIKSAQKRNRQRLRRRERNQHHLSTMRTVVKRARTAMDASPAKEDKGKAQKGATAKVNVTDVVKQAIRQIDKAAQKGVIARKAASRKISRLMLAANRSSAK